MTKFLLRSSPKGAWYSKAEWEGNNARGEHKEWGEAFEHDELIEVHCRTHSGTK